MRTYDKSYLYSSQETQLNQLRRYHNRDIKRRMLCYNYAGLTRKGFLRRRSRNERNPDGTYEPMTSLTFITKKGYRYLVNKIKETYRTANGVVKKMLKYEPKRKPQRAEQPMSYEDSTEKAKELTALLARY